MRSSKKSQGRSKQKQYSFPRVLVVIGPTASGKSDLAVRLAKKLNGEVISADSRQVYRGLDIGSGKITKREMRGIPHYLLDVASPKRTFTVAHYQVAARKALKNILRRGKLPIICGGTGLYIDSVLQNTAFPNVEPNPVLRKKLERLSAEQLFHRLKGLDAHRATTIDRHNKRRLIRAIEIVVATGSAVPPLRHIENSSLEIIKVGIFLPATQLKARIHNRLAKRLRGGLIAEVKRLRAENVSWRRLDDLGLEYRFVSRYLRGLVTKEEMVKCIEKESWRYAKRQMTWWKKDPTISWHRTATDAYRAAIFSILRH